MISKTNEQALEAYIEQALVGGVHREENIESSAEAARAYSHNVSYEPGDPADFDREFAIDREKFWRFLELTQPDELNKLRTRPNWQRLVLERLNRKIQRDGIVKVLKSGLHIDDAHLTLLYSLPYNTINPEVHSKFSKQHLLCHPTGTLLRTKSRTIGRYGHLHQWPGRCNS